jgi:MFS family permease
MLFGVDSGIIGGVLTMSTFKEYVVAQRMLI